MVDLTCPPPQTVVEFRWKATRAEPCRRVSLTAAFRNRTDIREPGTTPDLIRADGRDRRPGPEQLGEPAGPGVVVRIRAVNRPAAVAIASS